MCDDSVHRLDHTYSYSVSSSSFDVPSSFVAAFVVAFEFPSVFAFLVVFVVVVPTTLSLWVFFSLPLGRGS